MSCRVVVVGDSALEVHGVVTLLPPSATLLGASSSLQFLDEQPEKLDPEVFIVTLAQPSLSWAASIIRLAANVSSQVVLLTADNSSGLPAPVISIGIAGLNADRIAHILEKLVGTSRVEHRAEPDPPKSLSRAVKTLSSREIDVLRLVATGMSTKEIASRLCISARTVDFHRANIQNKTRLRSVAALTRYAMEQKIVGQGSGKELVA